MTYEEINALAIQHQRYDRSVDIFAFAEAMQNAVIEQCAAMCERIVLEEGHSATGHGAYLCRKYIRGLKSAPPEKPAGDVSDI